MRTPVLVLLFLLLSASLQAVEIPLMAVDKDLDLPLEGVRITAADGKTVQTDAEGKALVNVPDDVARIRLTASLIGYEPVKFWVSPGEATINLRMSIAGVVEGAELVVEVAKPQKTDEKVGVSQVATRDEIRNTAEMGLVEDVMSTIKALPGVGYGGGFDAALSIRGGKPGEMKCVLDGAYVLYPYHWGGAYSIFNPNLVESAKLSNGLIPAAYGQVLSGLLEVTSRTPAASEPQVDFGLSTTGTDLFTLVPFGDQAGLLIGGKVTWMTVAMELAKGLGMVPANLTNINVPYIRDAYARFFLKPDNTFEWDLNAFLGSDGVGMETTLPGSSNRPLATSYKFQYDNYFQLASTNLRAMAGQQGLFNFMVAWNRQQMLIDGQFTYNGTKKYDQAFLDSLPVYLKPASDSFTLNNLSNFTKQDLVWNSGQGKISFDLQLATGQIVTAGVESILTVADTSQSQSFWQDTYQGGKPVFKKVDFSLDAPENYTLASGGYLNWAFDFGGGLFTGELGLRLDHAAVWNKDVAINTAPTFDPRLRLALTPLRNLEGLDSLTFTVGSGLYAQVDGLSNMLDKKFGVTSENYLPTRSWFSVAGIEAQLVDGWKISAEGYYKYYFNRLYLMYDNRSTPTSFLVKTDGTGWAAGADLMIQKRLSRYWDGWLTYGFLNARYINPAKPLYDGQTTTNGELLDKEYYPTWHRFHTLNLISDWKPIDGFSVMAKFSLATGAPKPKVGKVTSYAAFLEDGTMIERFTRTTEYSDTDRNELSCPLDLKLTWSGYLGSGKINWQFYIGVENVLANIYTPKSNTSFDSWYGQESKDGMSADFNIGFPIPSIGFKLSY